MSAQESGRAGHQHAAGGPAPCDFRRRPDVGWQHAVLGHQLPVIAHLLSAECQSQGLDVGMIGEQPLRQLPLERVFERGRQLDRCQRIESVQRQRLARVDLRSVDSEKVGHDGHDPVVYRVP